MFHFPYYNNLNNDSLNILHTGIFIETYFLEKPSALLHTRTPKILQNRWISNVIENCFWVFFFYCLNSSLLDFITKPRFAVLLPFPSAVFSKWRGRQKENAFWARIRILFWFSEVFSIWCSMRFIQFASFDENLLPTEIFRYGCERICFAHRI